VLKWGDVIDMSTRIRAAFFVKECDAFGACAFNIYEDYCWLTVRGVMRREGWGWVGVCWLIGPLI
jgi:hypothetical protein